MQHNSLSHDFLSAVTDPIRQVLGMVRDLGHGSLSPYRPERHYMRGRGPAYQAKYGESQKNLCDSGLTG